MNHNIGEYVSGDVSTNQAESYFAQLKRSLDGTHHHVSRRHLHRYVSEFDFRFSTCKLADSERMGMMIAGTTVDLPQAHSRVGSFAQPESSRRRWRCESSGQSIRSKIPLIAIGTYS